MNNSGLSFIGDDFLLSTPTAQALYHSCATSLPLIDYHCHVSPREIYEDRQFKNITELWLGGDHYKWRLMRFCGVDERLITGDAPDKDKFFAFASVLPRAIGNPMYHWCHLELKKYFGYNGVLSADTAEEVWALCEQKLAEGNMGVRSLIAQSNVKFIGTTADPIDTLEWHKKLADDTTMHTTVAPSFRPDRALDIEKDGWADYIAALSSASGIEICDMASLRAALTARLEYFVSLGCRASDHGLSKLTFRRADDSELNAVMAKRLLGGAVSPENIEAFKTELLLYCAAEYVRLGVVMQIHYNCLRNPNSDMFARLGPDSGFDCIGTDYAGREKLALLLDAANRTSGLPKTIVYSLDPGENAYIVSLLGSFSGGECGKLQHGSAWWFNDNMPGMREQMTTLASLGVLGNFVGMLTDSRSFLSYTRHEYFRRILCALIGEWVENGEYPADINTLRTLVADICYGNAKRYFSI